MTTETTIQEAFDAQDASDMFFNNELVCKAYAAAHASEGAADTLHAEFVANLTGNGGFEPAHAEAIAKDFLARV